VYYHNFSATRLLLSFLAQNDFYGSLPTFPEGFFSGTEKSRNCYWQNPVLTTCFWHTILKKLRFTPQNPSFALFYFSTLFAPSTFAVILKTKHHRSKMKTKTILISLIVLASSAIHAQQPAQNSFNLQQAQEYAIKNSYSVKNALADREIARKTIWETTAMGLPQVNASLNYQNMLDVPTMLMPDFLTPVVVGVNQGLFGLEPIHAVPETEFFPVQFGAKHNADWGITATQLVFSGEYIVGLQASRIFYDLSEKALLKTQHIIKESVAKSYYLVLVAEENHRILQEMVANTISIRKEMEAMLEVGFIEDTDVDQMLLLEANLQNTLNNLTTQLEIANRLLKFQMGISLNETIELTDRLSDMLNMDDIVQMMIKDFQLANNIEFQMMETQEGLAELSLKRQNSTYLPSVAAFATYSESGMNNKFDLFDSSQDWFPTTIVGFSINIPVFSSGMRMAQASKARLELEKTRNLKTQVSEGLMLNYQQSLLNLRTAHDIYQTEKRNLELSERIYSKTTIKYREGVASSLDLTQVQNQYLTTQTNYFRAMVDMLNAKAELERMHSVL
jgi:outer membrane protein TolC